MIERKEIIYGYSGFQDLCHGCNKSEVEMRTQGFYGNMPQNKKSIFLTIIKLGYDVEGRQITKGEFYCQNCAVANLKEIISSIEVVLPPESGSQQITKERTSQAYGEFQRL